MNTLFLSLFLAADLLGRVLSNPSSIFGGGSSGSANASDNHRADADATNDAADDEALPVMDQLSTAPFAVDDAPWSRSVSCSSDGLRAWLGAFLLLPESMPPLIDGGMSPRTVVALIVVAVLCSLLTCIIHHRRRRKQLSQELDRTRTELRCLQDKVLPEPTTNVNGRGNNREIRIFMDGAFDMMHFGHMNAFRLARSLGTHLVVGVNSDESITQCKGAPLMNDQERLAMVSACKFVDEVVPDCPYVMSSQYLDWVTKKYRIDYVVHGDDPCIVDGKDVYAAAKAAGKFRSIPRTRGVSTTDIVGRLLLVTRERQCRENIEVETSGGGAPPLKLGTAGLGTQQSRFLTTSRLLQLYSASAKAPAKDMRVVYIDGAWDLFHPGHVSVLKAARERGDYLIVGIHGDSLVNRIKGKNLPLMNLHERVLGVLGCRFVDDVLIDAPYQITPDMITSLNIAEVVRGTLQGVNAGSAAKDEVERYRYAKEAGIFKVITVPHAFRIDTVVERIHKNHDAFQVKFERKMEAERQYSVMKGSSQMNAMQ